MYALRANHLATTVPRFSSVLSFDYGVITTVDLWPITGRQHQLRIHCASLGHPIVGDDLYYEYDPICADARPSTISLEQENGRAISPERGMLGATIEGCTRSKRRVLKKKGLFLQAVAMKFVDINGEERYFTIEESAKFGKFRDLGHERMLRKLNAVKEDLKA